MNLCNRCRCSSESCSCCGRWIRDTKSRWSIIPSIHASLALLTIITSKYSPSCQQPNPNYSQCSMLVLCPLLYSSARRKCMSTSRHTKCQPTVLTSLHSDVLWMCAERCPCSQPLGWNPWMWRRTTPPPNDNNHNKPRVAIGRLRVHSRQQQACAAALVIARQQRCPAVIAARPGCPSCSSSISSREGPSNAP